MAIKRAVFTCICIVLLMGLLSSGVQAKFERNALVNPNPQAVAWYVSPQGNDTNSCASPGQACLTIGLALSKTGEGDIVYVGTGTYVASDVIFSNLITHGITLSGGWNDIFTSQDGLSTYNGHQGDLCLRNISSVNALITHFVFQYCALSSKGAITNEGTLTIQDSTIQNNYEFGIKNTGEMTITRSTISNKNHNAYGGGIINLGGRLTLIASSVIDNRSGHAGGIDNQYGRLILINSSIIDNEGTVAGGIYSVGDSTIHIYNSTITHNNGELQGGGLLIMSPGEITTQNSIIAENLQGTSTKTPSDCKGTIHSDGYNLIGTTSNCDFVSSTGDILNTPPNGFPFGMYYALLPSSPAIDAGNPAGCLDNLGNLIISDQRGALRPMDGNKDGTSVCDIGSYEFDPTQPLQLVYMPKCSKPCPFIYQDDFSNPGSGWPIDEDPAIKVGYVNGEYQILIKQAGWYSAVTSGFQAIDYQASVQVRNVNGTNGSYGIIFGLMPDWSSWFSLEIYPDGWYGIYLYYVYGSYFDIEAEGFSPAIRQGRATNLIMVEQVGTTISAYANDQLLTTVPSIYHRESGYLGLINYAINQPGMDVRYDNYAVVPVDCSNQMNPQVVPDSWLLTRLAPGSNSNGMITNLDKHRP